MEWQWLSEKTKKASVGCHHCHLHLGHSTSVLQPEWRTLRFCAAMAWSWRLAATEMTAVECPHCHPQICATALLQLADTTRYCYAVMEWQSHLVATKWMT